ncbi:hypothetical protein HPB52_002708 [Rhipicephalus sanguineus]|uniref:Uncharacterized protein n=1 Tax=Rhipicephalus sanguineus TaxID=34632 RepID=A0A9D4PHR4_RHISA|nr:hypothetical protein HPB52_002708 [Rhipicephalus sanguineus]
MDPRLMKKGGSEREHEVGTPGTPFTKSLRGASDRCSVDCSPRPTPTLEENSTNRSQFVDALEQPDTSAKEAAVSEEPRLLSTHAPRKRYSMDAKEDAPPAIEGIAEQTQLEPCESLTKRAATDKSVARDMVVPTKHASQSPLSAVINSGVTGKAIPGANDVAEAPPVDHRETMWKRASIDKSVSRDEVIPTRPAPHSPIRTEPSPSANSKDAAVVDITEELRKDPREPLRKRASIDRSISSGVLVPTTPPAHSPLKNLSGKDILDVVEGVLQDIVDTAEMAIVDPREPLRKRGSIDRSMSLGMVVPTRPASLTRVQTLPVDGATIDSDDKSAADPREPMIGRASTDMCVSEGHVIPTSPSVRSLHSFTDSGGQPSAFARKAYRRRPETSAMSRPLVGAALAVMALAVVVLSILVVRRVQSPLRALSDDVCDTDDCVQHARDILATMDEYADPCVDLYAHVCGRGPQWTSKRTATMAHAYSRDVMPTFGDQRALQDFEPIAPAVIVASNAAKRCLDTSRGSEDETFVTFMRNRKLSWPHPAAASGHKAVPSDVLDVLLDLAVNWRVALWFDVTVSSWTRDGDAVVIVGEHGDVPTLRMEQLAEFDDASYDDVARNLCAFLSGGRVALDGATLEELRRDETAFRKVLLSGDEEDEPYDDLVLLSDVTEVFGKAASSMEWTSLLSKYLNSVINVSADTKLLIMNERRFASIGGLVGSIPVSRLLNVVGWTFAYAYAWIVNTDFDFLSAGTAVDLARKRVQYRWHSGSVLYLYALNELRLSLSALFPPSYLRGGSGAMTYAGLDFNLARQALRSVDLRGRALDGAGQNISWLDVAKSVAERRSITDLFALDLALAAMQQASEKDREKRPLRLKYLEGLTATQTFYVSYCSHYCGEPSGRRQCNVAMNGSDFGASFSCPHPKQPTSQACVFV